MHRLSLSRGLGVVTLALVSVLAGGCGEDEPAARSAASASSSPLPSTPSTAPVEGLQDEVPPPDVGFPASTADDTGEAQQGETADTRGQMAIAGIRLLPQNGYDRLIVDLDTAGVPFWTARYTEASTAEGEPVELAGDTFLRLGLFTENSSPPPVPAIAGGSGVIAEIRSTGHQGGYQEVLVGVRGATAPFRTFGLTDPGRIVVDIRPAG